MTGAAVVAGGVLLIICLILGVAIASVLKFGFKLSNRVWWWVPAVPLAAIGIAVIYYLQQMDRELHTGPEVQFFGSHSVTVSKKFGQAELDRAYAKLQSAEFKASLADYTANPMPQMQLNLTIQANEDARRFVSISTRPHYDVNTPTYEALMYLFSKAVIDSDPLHADTFAYSPPPKLSGEKAPVSPTR